MFTNPQTGAFDKAALLDFLKQIDSDNIASYPADQQAQLIQAKNFWLFWEKNIKRQRLEQKYTTLLSKAISANSLDAKELIMIMPRIRISFTLCNHMLRFRIQRLR